VRGCNHTVYNINNITDEIKLKMRDYDIKAVPTTIIDSKIKIVGIPWICSEDLYRRLEKDYPLKAQ
jgi:predicted DsbA family dithiol-disulfide isomerase